MRLIAITFILMLFISNLHGETVDDIRKKLGVKSDSGPAKSATEGVKVRAKGSTLVPTNVGTSTAGVVSPGMPGALAAVKGFKQVVGKYCVVQTKDMSSEDTENVKKYMDKLFEEFLTLHEYPFGTQKCYITVYGVKSDYDKVARAENMTRAKAFSYRKGINHYAVTYYDDDLYPTLAHETFHLFIENIYKGDIPYWFNEGMCCYYETCGFSGDQFLTNRVNKDRLAVAKGAVNNKYWPKLKDLIRISYDNFYDNNSSINYAASWSLVYYLKNKDAGAFKKFVNDLVLGKSFASSIRANYNMDQKELEKDWIEYVQKIS